MMDCRGKREKIERRLDVGGAKLHFVVWPGHESVIVFESGGGDDSTAWCELIETLPGKTGASIVVYDRAGFGQSDLPSMPYDLDQETGWLIRGLRQLGLDSDVVLVGHSYGGWLVRLHTEHLQDRVRGLVLVDPFSHEFVEMLGVEYLDRHPMCGADALRNTTPIEELPREMAALVRMTARGLGPKVARMAQTTIPPDIPLRVISSGGDAWWPQAHESDAWKRSHEEIATQSSRGKLIIAEGAGHMIPQQMPNVILHAIEEVLWGPGETG